MGKTVDGLTVKDVRDYMQRYHTARRQKRILENRRRSLAAELRTKRADHSEGTQEPVTVSYRLAEIESRIENQTETMSRAVLQIMDLMELLPEGSTERTILELRHIDCKTWERITDEIYMSRSRVIDYYNKAADTILQNERARQLIRKHKGMG